MKAAGIRLLPAFLSVGSWTMVSRVLGLARDIVMAALLGTGPVAQAFLIAFTLPNMFRRFFAEGAFNLAFVPLFAKKLEAGEDAEGFARDALSGLGLVLLLFTIAGQIAMPWLVYAMASGFAGDERFPLSVLYGRIAFPYIILISLTALLSGVLNGHAADFSGGYFDASTGLAPSIDHSAMYFVVGVCPTNASQYWIDLDRDGEGDTCQGVSPLPEPGSLSLLAGSALVAALARRRG